MDRRFFAKSLFFSGTGIIFIPKFNFLGKFIPHAPLENDPDFQKSLVYIHNGHALAQLSDQKLKNFYMDMNKSSFSSDFVPFSPDKKLTKEDISQLWETRYGQVEFKYHQDIETINTMVTWGSAIGTNFGTAAAIALPFSPGASLALGTIGLVTSTASSNLAIWAAEYGSTSSRDRLLQATQLDFNNKVFSQGLNFQMPLELKANAADIDNIGGKIANQTSNPPLSKKLGDSIIERFADGGTDSSTNSDIVKQYLEETNLFNDKVLEEGANAKEENIPLTEQQIKEGLALAQNLHELGNVLISKFAAEKEQFILKSLLNSGMQYLTLTSMGSAVLGPTGWTAIGVSVATSLLTHSDKGGSFEGAVMKAFEMVFKQLQEIRKSLQRIEERQINMLVHLEDIMRLLGSTKQDIAYIKVKLNEVVNLRNFDYSIATERFKGTAEAEGMRNPMNNIDKLGKVIYQKRSFISKNAELLRNMKEIKASFYSLYNYALSTSITLDYNGTGELRPEVFANPQNLKNTIFNPSFVVTSSPPSTSTVINRVSLYDSIGILPYIYKNYIDKDNSKKESPRNPKAFHKGVMNYITAQFIFPQKSIMSTSMREENAIQLYTIADNTSKELKEMVSKNTIHNLRENYLQVAQNLFFEENNTQTLHKFITRNLSKLSLIDTEGQDGDRRQMVNKVIQHFHLRTTGSNLKENTIVYEFFEMPFDGYTKFTDGGLVYNQMRNLNILRDSEGISFGLGYLDIPANFYLIDHVYVQNPKTFDIVELIKTFGLGKLSNIDSYSHEREAHGTLWGAKEALAVGQPLKSDLFELEFESLPFLNGIKIYFTQAKMIGGLRKMYDNPERWEISVSYSEYAFTGTPGIFGNNFQLTWKEQIEQQLKAKGRERELDQIPNFNSFTIIDFIFFLADVKMLEVKRKIINKFSAHIDMSFNNKHSLDHIGPSLYITSRLNSNIASKGVTPFEINYANQVFRTEDLQNVLQRLSFFDLTNKADKQLFDFLKTAELEETEFIQADAKSFDFNKSLFYYSVDVSGIDIHALPYGKLSLDDYYDFLLIYMRHKIIETADFVETSVAELDENHAEPFMADSMLMLNGFKNLLKGTT